jgi:hypothetical protein
MHTHPYRPWLVTAVCVVVLALTAGHSVAQESRSGPLAKQLAQAMEKAQLSTVAARDDSGAGDGHYVAAMFFPGSQLLVVSARYSVPILIEQKLADKKYMDMYIDLNSASVPESKIFVSDLLADGLYPKPSEGQPFDTFEKAGAQWAFNRDWNGQGISEDVYMQQFREADEQYAKMLGVLLTAFKK